MWLPFFGSVVGREPRTDAELIQGVAGGDMDALRRLYDRCSRAALALANRILGSRGEAEEAVQDAFLYAWRQCRHYDPSRGSAIAWMISIVRGRALDRLRSRSSLARSIESLAAEDPPQPPLPVELVEQRQHRQRIETALAELPADQRTAVELAYFDGLTQTEIAARTSSPVGTVKTRCRLALRKLAALLAEEKP